MELPQRSIIILQRFTIAGVMKISDNKKTSVLIMTRKKIVLPDDSIQKKNRKLSKYIGAGKGIFGSPKEADKFICKQRKEWE